MINFPHLLTHLAAEQSTQTIQTTHILFIRSQSIQHTIYKMHANTIFFVNLLLYSYLFKDHCINIFTHLVLFLRGHARLKSDMFLIMTPLIEDILRRKKMFLNFLNETGQLSPRTRTHVFNQNQRSYYNLTKPTGCPNTRVLSCRVSQII